MRFEDLNWNDIVMEAPEDVDDGGGEELSATDYTDAENLEIDEATPDDEMDEGGDEELDLGDEDEIGLDEDAVDEDENIDDETPEEEQTDNDEESDDIVSDKQNKYLIHDFIELYKRMDEILSEIRSNGKIKLHINPNFLVVRKNIEKLREVTYDYIIDKFAKESYVSNLYQFNLTIQALNVNVDLLDSLLKSAKLDKEKEKKKETKKKR
jgi:hypothetical protein